VFRYMTPADLMRFARSNHRYCELLYDFLKHAFDARKILSKHFSDKETVVLQALMRTHGALISGSAALQFFERVNYDGSSLDLYVEQGRGDLLQHWLR
ncbi:hypothetical protein BDN72DRAFT_731308, partial [Pluteus cervinus]